MRKYLTIVGLAVIAGGQAQDKKLDYEKASAFMSYKLEKLLYRAYVNPQLTEGSTVFTYTVNTTAGREFYFVDPEKKVKRIAFNHEELAKLLSIKTGKTYKAGELPFSQLHAGNTGKYFTFKVDTSSWKYSPDNGTLDRITAEKEYSDTEVLSPDKKKLLVWENHNLKLKDLNTGKVQELTKDGSEKLGYGSSYNWYAYSDETNHEPYDYDLEAYWSPDSRKIVIPLLNRSRTQYMKMLQWSPKVGLRPHLMSYERAMPGDTDLTTATFLIIDTESGKSVPVDLKEIPEFLGTGVYFSDDSKKAYRVEYERGYTGRKLTEIDMQTGKSKVLMEEKPATSVDVRIEYFQAFTKSNEYLWMAGRICTFMSLTVGA